MRTRIEPIQLITIEQLHNKRKKKKKKVFVGSRSVLLNQNCDSLVIYFRFPILRIFTILKFSYCRAIVIAPIKETKRIMEMSSNGR
jgi:hypothetical protein